MAQYEWREGGPPPKVGADVFGAVVEALAADRDEVVPHEAIVEEARKRGSPIRALFDWNDTTAAHAHRLQQARHYLSRLVIVVVEQRTGRATSSRAFYSVNYGERGYMAQGRVLSDRDLKLQVIAAAKRELETYLVKYGSVLRLFGNYIPRLNTLISDMQSDINRLAHAATKKKGGKGDGAGAGASP